MYQQEQLSLLRKQLAAAELRFAEEIARLRDGYGEQVADLKQTIMNQDRVYRHMAEQMEARLAALQQSMAAAPKSAAPQQGSVRPPHPDANPPLPSRQRRTRSSSAATPSRKGDVGGTSAVADTNEVAKLPFFAADVLTRYRSRINAIYDHYAMSSAGDALFHPLLGMGAFARMVRDAKLTPSASAGQRETTAELLWMGVVRELHARHPAATHHSDTVDGSAVAPSTPRNPSRSTIMTRGRYHPATPDARDKLGFLRVEKIPREHFGEALFLLWSKCRAPRSSPAVHDARRQSPRGRSLDTSGVGTEASGNGEVDGAAAAEDFSAFLLHRVFPMTAKAMEKQRRRESSLLTSSYYSALQHSTNSGTDNNNSSSPAPPASRLEPASVIMDSTFTESPRDYAAIINDVYGPSSLVKSTVKEFASDIKRSYQAGIRGVGNDGMDIDDFFSLVQKYHLLPLIRKPEIKHIFVTCATEDAARKRSAKARLSLSTYVHALYCLAEGIYNVPAVAHHYPNPEHRLRKLLTKMFLLET